LRQYSAVTFATLIPAGDERNGVANLLPGQFSTSMVGGATRSEPLYFKNLRGRSPETYVVQF